MHEYLIDFLIFESVICPHIIRFIYIDCLPVFAVFSQLDRKPVSLYFLFSF